MRELRATDPRPGVAAAILAGGRARRFGGRDKSRLPVQGRPIINRQLDVLQQLTPHVFVVGGDADRFADLGLRVVPDAFPRAGTLGGIGTAVDAADQDLVIVVGCDLPFLDAGLLAHLTDLAHGHDGAWIVTARGPEPLLACYRQSTRDRIRQAIEAGRLKASELGHDLDLAVMPEADVARFGPPERLLANVNTPEEYDRWRE